MSSSNIPTTQQPGGNNNGVSNSNNNNINNQIISTMFKTLETSKIIQSIDEMIKLLPDHKKELMIARSLIDQKDKNKFRFDEKIETIKKNALKDFTKMNDDILINSNNNGNNNNGQLQLITSEVLNLYTTLRSMVEFNNHYQRKYLKDYFQPSTSSPTKNATTTSTSNDSNKTQLQKILNELSSFHNSAPLSFIDMVYKDYSIRYVNMFTNPFIFKNSSSNEGEVEIEVIVPPFKICLSNQEDEEEEDISQIILNIYYEIQRLTKHHYLHHSNILFQTIFKSIDINKIVITIDNLVKIYPNYENSLMVIKELMLSKDGQKGINVKIETIKRNAIKLIMDETIIKDRKQVIESDLYSKYLELRIIVEFSFMFQRKLLKEHPVHKLQSSCTQLKRMNDLSILHNSSPLYIYDLAKRDFGRFSNNKIAKNFNFTIDGENYTIPLFKISPQPLIGIKTTPINSYASIVANHTVTIPPIEYDISDAIQILFNQVYQMVQKYKHVKTKSSPGINITSNNCSGSNSSNSSNEDESSISSSSSSNSDDISDSDSNGVISNNSNKNTNTNIESIIKSTISNLKDNDQVIMNILKFIFDYKNFEQDLFYNRVMTMKKMVPKYSGSILSIRETIVNNKKYYNEFLESIILLKKDIQFDMDSNGININQVDDNNNDNNSNDEQEQVTLLYNECLSRLFSFRALICFNFFHQRVQLKERLEIIGASLDSIGIESMKKLIEIQSNYSKELFNFNSIKNGIFDDTLLNNDLILDINTNDKKSVTIRVFKFGGESITGFVSILFFESHDLINKLLKKQVNNSDVGSGSTISNTESPQKLEDSILENRKQNEQLLQEIEKLKEQISNLKKEGEELEIENRNTINNNNNNNACTTSI